jgi:cysteine-rich repeat protein
MVALLTAWMAGCVFRSPPGASVPPPGACGDGVLDFDEDCDDGNLLDGDGCSSRCLGSLHWVAADPHVHDDGCEAADLTMERLLPAARQAGLGVVSVLLWAGDLVRRAEQFTGRDDAASTADLIVHHDVEVSGLPAAPTGHLMLLGLTPPLDPVLWEARSSVAIVERMRLQRPELLIGMAHAGWPDPDPLGFPAAPGAPVDLPVHAARGDLDFLEFELALPKQSENLDWIALSTWVRLQNAGFRIPLVSGSDYPCGNKWPGNTRSYVLVDGAATYGKYLDAIRRGRVTMAVYGDDRLDLRIGTARIGDEVRAGRSVTLRIESLLARADDIAVMVNGEKRAAVHVPAGPQVRSLPLQLDGSAWIHLRGSRAMTNAVYVVVDGAPLRPAPADLCYFLGWIDRAEREAGLDLGSDRAVSAAAHEEAREVFHRRLRATGAVGCP